MKQAIIITGNPVDGFIYTGPFEDYDTALAAGEQVFHQYDIWWIADLEASL